jgi:hypothetical protein
MRGGRHSRYTIFDVMEHRGVFDENPANSTSPRFAGPQEYPKMFYHPMGKQRLIQKAEILQTPYGPTKVGEQYELIARVVSSAEEEERARRAGWHDHPAKAIQAGGGNAPAMTAHGRIADLERQLVNLQAQLNAARQAPPPIVDEFSFDAEPNMETEQLLEHVQPGPPRKGRAAA